jgi:hypothetical protein
MKVVDASDLFLDAVYDSPTPFFTSLDPYSLQDRSNRINKLFKSRLVLETESEKLAETLDKHIVNSVPLH